MNKMNWMTTIKKTFHLWCLTHRHSPISEKWKIEWTFTCIQCDFFQYLDPNLSNSLLFDRQWDPLTDFGRFWIFILGKDNFLVNPLKFWFWKWGSRLSQLLVEINYVFLFTNSLTSGSLFWIWNLMLYQEFSRIFQSVFRKSRQRNNAIDKHSNYVIVIKELIPLIEWTCYFKKLFEGIDLPAVSKTFSILCLPVAILFWGGLNLKLCQSIESSILNNNNSL